MHVGLAPRRSHVPITFRCSCGKTLEIADEHAGKKGRCPECGSVLDIPRPDERVMEAAILEAEEVPHEEYADVVAVEEPAPQRRPGPAAPPGPSGPQRLEDLPNHNGEALPSGIEFFALPPEELGPLLSAYSTLRTDKEPWSLAGRLAWFFGCAAVGLVFTLIFAITKIWVGLWLSALVALVAALVSLWLTRFDHSCSFVGRDGVARYRCRGDRDNVSGGMFLFRN